MKLGFASAVTNAVKCGAGNSWTNYMGADDYRNYHAVVKARLYSALEMDLCVIFGNPLKEQK